MSKILSLYLLCASAALCSAQRLMPFWDVFPENAGITGIITDMQQDADGFYWISSTEGLFRFDGRRAVRIHYLAPDTLPLSSRLVRSLSIDHKRHWLWFAAQRGLFQYDMRQGIFTHWPDSALFGGQVERPGHVSVVWCDEKGRVWSDVGHYGIVRFDPDTRTTEVFKLPLNDKEKQAGLDENMAHSLRCIARDAVHPHVLWVTTRRGLLRLDESTKTLERFVFYPDQAAIRRNGDAISDANAMPTVYAHPNGKVYCSTWDAGLLVLDPATRQFSQFFQNDEGWTEHGDIHRVHALLPDGAGNLWVRGSRGGSLFAVDQQRFIGAPHPDAAFDFKDHAGHYWQHAPVLRLCHRLKNQTPRIAFPPSIKCRTEVSSEVFDTVHRTFYLRSYCQDGIWGLQVDDGTWRVFRQVGTGGENSLSASAENEAGFWVVDVTNRLFLRAPNQQAFIRQPLHLPAHTGNLNMRCAQNGDIFITGHEGYLFWLKKGKKVPETYYKNSMATHASHFSGASSPALDHRGRLWMHTSGGFSIFSPEQERFLHVSKKNGQPHLSQYNGFLREDSIRMWTHSAKAFGWIDVRRPEAGIQKQYTLPFSNQNIHFLRDSCLWITTGDGLLRFHLRQETATLFEHLNTRNFAAIGRGKAIMVWDSAYTIFHLDSLKANAEIPKPYLSWFKVFEKNKALSGSPFAPELLNLRHDEHFLSFGFSALALYDPGKIKFAYQLEGIDRDWVYPEENVFSASYTNLEGGDYVLRLKTTNSRGEWQHAAFALPIHIATVWYKTLWARSLFLLLLVWATVQVYQAQRRRWAIATALRLKEQEAKRLEELDAFKTLFFTNITHEFRTPLTVIEGLSEEVRTGLQHMEQSNPALAARCLANVAAVQNNSKALLHLVNQMLDLARIEAGQMQLRTESTEVIQELRAWTASFTSLAQLKDQTLHFYAEPDICWMETDPQRLCEITGNLISNALKFSPAHAAVSVRVQATGRRLTISVSDQGPGIAEAEQAHIFDRFYRAENTGADPQPGTGIGLALVKEWATLMKGNIRVESQPGAGSTFILDLPLSPAPRHTKTISGNLQTSSDHLPAASNKPPTASDGLQPASNDPSAASTILLVEDHPDLLNYLRQLLGAHYHLLTAQNGRAGLEQALEHVPDLIVSDVMMPEMDGFTLCEHLKTDVCTSHIPLVLLTAKATVADKVQGLRHGADAYLPKPFDRAELLATLRNLLENRARLRAYFGAAIATQQPTPDEWAAEDPFIQRIRHLLDTHLADEAYDVPGLCQDLAMSRMQLHRKITALAGQPPAQFMRSFRLEKARHLLETTGMNVSEVAYATGFSDHAWFSKTFKEKYGKTPSEARSR